MEEKIHVVTLVSGFLLCGKEGYSMGLIEVFNQFKQAVFGVFSKSETSEAVPSTTPEEVVNETPQVREFRYIRNDSSWHRKTFERARR